MDKIEKIAIVTDSCADVPEEYRKKYSISVLPMVITTSEGEYQDGVDIHADDIYRIQQTEMPKTGCPTGAAIMDTFDELLSQGYNKALVVLLSGSLSGTVNSIQLLAKGIEGMEIAVFDSLKASIGIGAVAIQAARYVESGMSFEELKQAVGRLIRDTKVFFSIDTLEYLQKGGRIGKATAVAGTLLKIKPVLSFDEETGEIYTAAKVRGKAMVESHLALLVQEFAQGKNQKDSQGEDDRTCAPRVKTKYNLIVADGGAPGERKALEERMKEMFPDYQDIFRAEIGAALSVYLGKGLLGAGIQFFE